MKKQLSEQQIIRREKAKKLIEQNINIYGEKKTTHNLDLNQLHKEYKNTSKEELEIKKIECKVYGRIMLKREAGKACFFNIENFYGKIQCYTKKEELKENFFEQLLTYDLGDFVFVEGYLMKTKTGELTIRCLNVELWTKSLNPLFDKYDKLQDQEEKYRKRYLDLLADENSKNRFIKRSLIINRIREYLNKESFIEVETPILQHMYGGASAKPFITHHNALKMDLYLRIAPELYLKRLLVGGFEKIYEIGKNFRNEGISVRHNPEFSMIEIYQVNSDYEDMMELTENIFKQAAKNDLSIIYNNSQIDLSNKWKRIHMVDAIREKTNIDFFQVNDLEQALDLAKKFNLKIDNFKKSVGHIINEFFENFVEPFIVEPTFIFGHPVEISPLAKQNLKDRRFTDRFELFILGREYANGFSELNNPFVQSERFESQMLEKKQGNDEISEFDHDFIEALEYGMPPTGGLGIGIDRLVMLLTNSYSIRDVLFFPQLKNEK